jgi:hypothetical protein
MILLPLDDAARRKLQTHGQYLQFGELRAIEQLAIWFALPACEMLAVDELRAVTGAARWTK